MRDHGSSIWPSHLPLVYKHHHQHQWWFARWCAGNACYAESLYRADGDRGASIVYQTPGEILAAKITVWTAAKSAELDFSVSADGQQFKPLDVAVQRITYNPPLRSHDTIERPARNRFCQQASSVDRGCSRIPNFQAAFAAAGLAPPLIANPPHAFGVGCGLGSAFGFAAIGALSKIRLRFGRGQRTISWRRGAAPAVADRASNRPPINDSRRFVP